MKAIIVGTDFSKGSYVAIEIAIDIANKLRTDVKIVWVEREKMLIDEEQPGIMHNLAQDKLQMLCEQHQEKLLHGKVKWEIVHGKVSTALSTAAAQAASPMIVIGTNGASGFEKYWMGSTAVRIVQESRCPVLTIREGFNFHKSLERIVMPIRVNSNSREKVPPAASMAKIFDSEVHILGLIDTPADSQSLRVYMQQTSDFLTKEGIRHTSTVKKYSNYSDTVLKYADEVNADLVVINTEQDRIIAQMFLGTNAQQIVHKSQIPVLCIHPQDIINVAR